jgi:hypothetical protein
MALYSKEMFLWNLCIFRVKTIIGYMLHEKTSLRTESWKKIIKYSGVGDPYNRLRDRNASIPLVESPGVGDGSGVGGGMLLIKISCYVRMSARASFDDKAVGEVGPGMGLFHPSDLSRKHRRKSYGWNRRLWVGWLARDMGEGAGNWLGAEARVRGRLHRQCLLIWAHVKSKLNLGN